jgi:hypothetical protein
MRNLTATLCLTIAVLVGSAALTNWRSRPAEYLRKTQPLPYGKNSE